MTSFADLPDLGNGYRMAGSQLLDEEQWLVERWHDYKGELRPTVEGIRRYAALRASRKEQRHVAWQVRQESDDAWSDEINRTIEEGTKS
jgi:hypothetical protein